MRGIRLTNLRKVRKQRGFMIDYMALSMHVSKYTYMGWESTKPSPNKDDVARLCMILNVKLEDLI